MEILGSGKDALALLGAVTGSLGLILGWLGFRRDRINLKVTVGSKVKRRYIFWVHEDIGLTVRVNNLGRAECEVTNGWWEVDDKERWDSASPRSVHNRPQGSSAFEATPSPFPLVVPGLAAREWVTKTPKRPDDRTADGYKMRYVVLFGHDKRVKSPWILVMTMKDVQPPARVYDRLALPRLWRPVREVLGSQDRSRAS